MCFVKANLEIINMTHKPFTGRWLRSTLKMYFPLKKDKEIAKMIGISPQAFSNWGSNDSQTRMPSAETLYLGYCALGMLHMQDGNGNGGPPPSRSSEWPVRRTYVSGENSGAPFPENLETDEAMACPAGLTLVPVQGDSMAPLILPGQYVMIDKNRSGLETNGGIVVVSVIESDGKTAGTYITRCFEQDGHYHFSSVNPNYSLFSSWHGNCRIWPVLGLWFGNAVHYNKNTRLDMR